MKLSELKTIIREEIQKELLNIDVKASATLHENIIADIIALILTPKVKKDAKKFKDTPEMKELEAQVRQSYKEIEMINKRLERRYEEFKKLEAEAKKKGIKLGMSAEQYKKLFSPAPVRVK